jgi:large subunit ribosomal protein L19
MLRRTLTSAFERTASNLFARSLSSTTSTVDLQNAPFFHFRQRNGVNPKFKSPRKRASKLFHQLNQEACETIRGAKPDVFEPRIEIGDAIELEVVTQGGVNSSNPKDVEKIRGVLIAKSNRGLETSVLLRDVLFGEPVERKVFIYSPLVRSIKILEKNFVYKGKRKVKRAKLYFLRNRNPSGRCLSCLFAH